MAQFSTFCAITFALMALLLFAEAKSSDESTDRIYGGEAASPGQFPYQVSVRAPKYGYVWHFCGGVLISDQFVLTTANCTQGLHSRPANVTVVVGTHTMDPLDSGTAYAVSKITNHPLFDQKTMSNDISVIKTVNKVAFTKLVQPVQLPASNVVAGTAATISGWGRFNVSFCSHLSDQKINFFIYIYSRRTIHMSTGQPYYATITRTYWNKHYALNVWVFVHSGFTRILFAQLTRTIRVYALAISAAHWSNVSTVQ